MVVNTLEYDALHRRVKKAVSNSAALDCTYHYYYDGQQIVETHNGSEQVIQQFVWGQMYIDELVQVGLNDDPTDGTEQDVETFHYAMHNANYNVIGLVDDAGAMVERYEYTPYGERQVYISAGLNDPDCYAPIKKSKRVQVAGVDQPWGVNPVGHQGLFHDEETKLVNNRRRILHPRIGRFIQTDPLGYPDGMNRFAAYHIQHGVSFDPMGLTVGTPGWSPGGGPDGSIINQPREEKNGPVSKKTACCGESKEKYDPETQCCEDGKVVGKVSVWKCERPLANGSTISAFCFLYTRWITPKSWDFSHSYICCDGSNQRCYGKQSDNVAGDDVPIEALQTGTCEEHRVCPSVKSEKCDSPKCKTDYRFPGRVPFLSNSGNCHDFAWRDLDSTTRVDTFQKR